MWDFYNTVKQDHPADLVLFQVGDFFEMFGEDAKQAAELLELATTTRNIPNLGQAPMCGVPAHALERYTERLRAKYSVTIAAVDDKTGEQGVYTLPSMVHEAERTPDAHEAIEDASGVDVGPTGLHVKGHDFNARREIDYYHEDAEKQELLRTSLALKDHRVEIAAYFATHEDSIERGDYIKAPPHN